MKFKRQTIYVTTEKDNPKSTVVPDALVLGDLAVHRGLLTTTLEPLGDWYTVTHIPSGLKLVEANRQSSCRKLVERLVELGIDWSFTDTRKPPQQFFDLAQPIIREFISNPLN